MSSFATSVGSCSLALSLCALVEVLLRLYVLLLLRTLRFSLLHLLLLNLRNLTTHQYAC